MPYQIGPHVPGPSVQSAPQLQPREQARWLGYLHYTDQGGRQMWDHRDPVTKSVDHHVWNALASNNTSVRHRAFYDAHRAADQLPPGIHRDRVRHQISTMQRDLLPRRRDGSNSDLGDFIPEPYYPLYYGPTPGAPQGPMPPAPSGTGGGHQVLQNFTPQQSHSSAGDWLNNMGVHHLGNTGVPSSGHEGVLTSAAHGVGKIGSSGGGGGGSGDTFGSFLGGMGELLGALFN